MFKDTNDQSSKSQYLLSAYYGPVIHHLISSLLYYTILAMRKKA